MKVLKSIFISMLFILVLFIATTPVLAEQSQHNITGVDMFESLTEIPVNEHSKMAGRQLVRDNVISSLALRVAKVELNEALAEGLKLNPGATVKVELFDNEILEARVERVESDVKNITATIGTIEDTEYGYLITSALDGKVLTIIELPDLKKQYQVVYDSQAEGHFLYEFSLDDLDKLPSSPAITIPEGVEFATSKANNLVSGSEENASSQAMATVDVMVVYTVNARNWANANATSINHSISQAMQRAKLVASNSNIYINFNLVHSGQINYTEYTGEPIWVEAWGQYISGSDVDLINLTSGSGECAIVHQWRDQYGADLVAMFSRVEDTGGIGWALEEPAGTPAFGYSITRVQQAHNTYTHIHEMGHNMGAGHHKGQNFQPGPQMHSYSAGWRWGDTPATRKCSVMAYEEGRYYTDGHDHVRVAYFSNPNVTLDGFATGHPQHGDNARTIRDIRFIIASYRDSSAPPPPPGPEDVTISASPSSPTRVGERVTFTATTTGMSNPRFQFWYRSSGGQWSKYGGITSVNHFSYNFPSAWSGEIGVQAFEQGTKNFKTDSISHRVTLVPPVESVNLRAEPANQARPNQEVKFIAQAVGGYNPEYAFYYRIKGDSKWRKIFDYSKYNALIVNNVNREIDIELGVLARSSGSRSSYEAKNSINYSFRWGPLGSTPFDLQDIKPDQLEVFVTEY